jgi:hypothetical protein
MARLNDIISRAYGGAMQAYNDVAASFSEYYADQQQQQPNTSSANTIGNGPWPLPSGTSASVTLVGGAGIASIGPQRVREHWQITSIAVNVATNVAEASCSLYLGSTITSSVFLGTTATGSSGDTYGMGGQDIQPGQMIFAQWAGGDATSQATVTIQGTRTNGAPQ